MTNRKKPKTSFDDFLAVHSPRTVRRHLRTILFDYIRQCGRTGAPLDYDRMLHSMEGLIDLLEAAEEEAKQRKKPLK